MTDNPPALPSQMYGSDGLPCSDLVPGMTLRGWFAGQALTGLMTRADSIGPDEAAACSYYVADAMLAERSKS